MCVPRAYSFPKELGLVCDVKSVIVENTYESDFCTVDDKVDREVDKSNTIARVLLSLNLEMGILC